MFSAKFACPVSGFTISEIEPRLFSFNSPSGACATCDGLGQLQVFDAERVVTHPDASLAEGAIRGWDRRNPYYWALVSSLAKHYKFDTDKPFAKLPEKARNAVLYGSGDDKIAFEYPDERGKIVTRIHKFEGVLPNLERRYKETESVAVREELAKYLSDKPCPDCHGDRLNRSARHVFVGGSSLPSVVAKSVRDAEVHFQQLKLPGHKGEIAEKILNSPGL